MTVPQCPKCGNQDNVDFTGFSLQNGPMFYCVECDISFDLDRTYGYVDYDKMVGYIMRKLYENNVKTDYSSVKLVLELQQQFIQDNV